MKLVNLVLKILTILGVVWFSFNFFPDLFFIFFWLGVLLGTALSLWRA